MHARRRTLAAQGAGFAHLADPFPATIRRTILLGVPPGQSRDLYFINPGRCMTARAAAQPYGHIRVVP